MKDVADSSRPPIKPRGADAGPAPLSAAQERLWILEQLESGGAAYSEPYRAHIEGRVDLPALVRSLHQIVERHAILRTTVAVREGRPVQIVAGALPPALPAVIDLSALPSARRRPVAEAIAAEDAARAFDLDGGPLVRSHLIRLSQDEHELLCNLHHIVCDDASIAILVQELSSLYGADVAGRPSPLPELPIQYADFARWQRDEQLAGVLEEHLPYWERQLAGAPTVLTMPSDRPRRPIQRFRGRRQNFLLPKELLAALKALGEEEGATLLMTLLAASGVLLGRYTRQRDLLIGSPIDGRDRSELAGLIGFFVNTLVLRVDLHGDPTVRELLGRVRRTTLEAYEHQEVPFAALVEKLRPKRSPSHGPLVQVMLILPPPPVRIDGAGDCVFRLERIPNSTAKYDLTAILRETEEGLRLGLEYSTDLFDDSSIESVAQHFEVLYTAFAAGADRPISTLPLLTAAEERQFRRWQGRRDSRPRGAAMAERVTGLFEAQVAWTPDAPAVILGEESLSYRQLNHRANRLAHYLRGLGIGPEVAVGLAVEPAPEMLVGVLGILKAGGVYVPLNPAHPRARLELMTEDTGIAVLLTQERLVDRLPASGVRTIRLDADWAEIEEAPKDNPEPQTTSDNLAYQIFTSGSTGRPKGVGVTHRSLIHLTLNLIAAHQLKEGDRVLMLLSLSFDASIGDLFPTILSGATLVLHPSPAQLAGRELEHVCEEYKISLLELSASFWEQWIDKLVQRGEERLPSTLRTVVVGGDSITPEKVRTWFRLAPGAMRLYHSYGPTEATVCATSLALERGKKRALGKWRVPIGSPLSNVEIHVTGPYSLQPMPVGVPGEICIGGQGVARGYLGRPAVTAAVFVPHPWSEQPGARLYRTGDLARWLPGGELEFLERIDRQVKIRGYRVEPGEIEAALSGHPALLAACVAAREEPSGVRRLVAWVVADQTPAPTPSALRAFLGERLPEHMVPTAFVVLDALPLDVHGKVDRGALPEPGAGRPELDAGYVAPRDRTERTIAEIWQQVLGVRKVGIRDDFFDLGGHSLLLIEVRNRLSEALGREAQAIKLFRRPTIEAQAKHLAAVRKAVTAAAVRPAAAPRVARGGLGDVAIIGMSGRFPRARTVDELWENLHNEVDCISSFTDQELAAAGVDAETLANPNFVKAKGMIDDPELFDAAFFDIDPREAALIDPQHRLFLECCWEALEGAGYDPESYPSTIGVLGGSGPDTYLHHNVYASPELAREAGSREITAANSGDFLCPRVSFKLNLGGPSVVVRTADSTSLVAVHMACRSLRVDDCDMVLAGGVTVTFPRIAGTFRQEGDDDAGSMVPGDGVAVVLLKRLEDALAVGDPIRAVIRGSGISNDGGDRTSMTGPGVVGPTRAIRRALAEAEVSPETVTFVETHGTGTLAGDRIEIEGLKEGYGGRLSEEPCCALASLGTNVGHLDIAAGAAGLIKTALALEHGEIPASLHGAQPIAELMLEESRFFVNTARRPWPRGGGPRRAGVNSLGLGGTHAHVILEEAPVREPSEPARPWQLLVLSARTSTALEAVTDRLADHLDEHPELDLADVAYTLQVGRRVFDQRRVLVCRDRDDAVAMLRSRDGERVRTSLAAEGRSGAASTVYLFPDSGSQYLDMGRELYRGEPVYREQIDRCAELFQSHLREPDASEGVDIRRFMFPDPGDRQEAEERLEQPSFAEPALFATEYALARLWTSWGVAPAAMIGHGLGECVAACFAGVLSLEDAVAMVALRGRLLAGVPRDAIPDPIVDEFRTYLGTLRLQAPAIPIVSSVTGRWLAEADATDPDYRIRHLRGTAHFSEAVETVLAEGDRMLLEVGPGRTLAALVEGRSSATQAIQASMRSSDEEVSDVAFLLGTLGELWLAGLRPDWTTLHVAVRRYRLPLPTYPFERRRFWVDPSNPRQ
ncbi:MAG: amino acid adenylation domain-containing protein [bacterium]|nr:amino acid adenylation domain-containing protein [bacterium]